MIFSKARTSPSKLILQRIFRERKFKEIRPNFEPVMLTDAHLQAYGRPLLLPSLSGATCPACGWKIIPAVPCTATCMVTGQESAEVDVGASIRACRGSYVLLRGDFDFLYLLLAIIFSKCYFFKEYRTETSKMVHKIKNRLKWN